MTTVSVAIATLRRPEVLATALASVAGSTMKPLEVVVVDGDDGRSAEPVVEAAAAEAPYPVRYLPSERGLTRQRNLALDHVDGDVVVFIDDDARLEPDALERLVSAYDDPAVVGVSGRVLELDSNKVVSQTSPLRRLLFSASREGTFARSGYPRRLVDATVARDVEFMPGCFMSARVTDAREVRFDERLLAYALAEDEDFSCRLSRRGRIRHVPAAVVHHDNSGFFSRDRRAFGRMVVRNRAYLFRKNFPQTWRGRGSFALLLLLLVGHRLLNRDLQGLRGLLEGTLDAIRSRSDLPAPR